jgi:hypothetical protein
MNTLQPNPLHERDLSLETPRDENYSRNSQPAAPSKSVKRSFSWGKRKKAQAEKVAAGTPVALSEEATVVTIDPVPASFELGLELHAVTGDVFVSYVGPSISGIEPGDNVLAIDGMPLDGGDMDALLEARQMLRDSRQAVQLILQRHSVRREMLVRHAALRGTSLDKIGLTLSEDRGYVVVTDMGGIAGKSRRVAVGDRLIAINGTRVSGNLGAAVELLQEIFQDDSSLEVPSTSTCTDAQMHARTQARAHIRACRPHAASSAPTCPSHMPSLPLRCGPFAGGSPPTYFRIPPQT